MMKASTEGPAWLWSCALRTNHKMKFEASVVNVLCLEQLGIKLDLRDKEAWHTLAGYILWVAIIQV